MGYIDTALLDLTERVCRAFQRLTGRTNVWLAVQVTNLSIIVYFAWAAMSFSIGGLAMRTFIAIFATGVLYALTQTVLKVPIETSEQAAYNRVARGLRNPRRVRDAILRVSFLTVSIIVLLMLSFILGYPLLSPYFKPHVQVLLLGYSVIVLTTVVLYLLACDPLPPCAGRVRDWLARPRAQRLEPRAHSGR